MASRISYLMILAAWIAALWWGLDFAGREKSPPIAVPTTQLDWADFFATNIPVSYTHLDVYKRQL